MSLEQVELDKQNSDFWNELCGSSFARTLGITDHSKESLARFDKAYHELYPYLIPHIAPARMKGKKVLEIGLGYGTISQHMAEQGALYHGLDIAAGPVAMVNHRLRMAGLPGEAKQGSMLDCPHPAETFDYVVSIGCYHHTGDIQKCVDETYRVLKLGGTAIIMVYNQFSYRQWYDWPGKTFLAWLADHGLYGGRITVEAEQRRPYDAIEGGDACPEIVFTSVKGAHRYFRKYRYVRVSKENCLGLNVGSWTALRREALLQNVGKLAGLDLYIEAVK